MLEASTVLQWQPGDGELPKRQGRVFKPGQSIRRLSEPVQAGSQFSPNELSGLKQAGEANRLHMPPIHIGVANFWARKGLTGISPR